eukprot:2216963-Prymnesium_polylepis.2
MGRRQRRCAPHPSGAPSSSWSRRRPLCRTLDASPRCVHRSTDTLGDTSTACGRARPASADAATRWLARSRSRRDRLSK